MEVKQMKKWTMLLALLVALVVPFNALAATVTDLMFEVDCLLGGGLIVAEDYPEYWLADDTGAALSPRYVDVSEESDRTLAEVMVQGEGINVTGLIDTCTGAEVLPACYGTVELLNDRWIVGVVLVLSEDPDAPYYDWSGNHYDLQSADVYYGGVLLVTLPAEECGDFYADGDFLRVEREDCVIWLNAAGEKRVYEYDYDYTYEYSEDIWEETFIHNGSGQQAFVPACTLTADQVEEPYTMSDAGVIDLQGNVVIPVDAIPEDAYIDEIHGGYVSLYVYDHEANKPNYGLMRMDGTLLIPFTVERLPDENWFTYGVMPVLTLDGQLCFYDETGALVASMPMPEGADVYDVDGLDEGWPMLLVDADGAYSVLSATAGVLDVSAYEEVKQDWDGGYGLLCVRQNGKWGCIDMTGALVVPCELEYAPDTSRDNTRVLGVYRHEELGYIHRLYELTD